jgi:hypothetical protein
VTDLVKIDIKKYENISGKKFGATVKRQADQLPCRTTKFLQRNSKYKESLLRKIFLLKSDRSKIKMIKESAVTKLNVVNRFPDFARANIGVKSSP